MINRLINKNNIIRTRDMRKELIKYESLSSEIRAEIKKRHDERVKINDAITLEDTMMDWFVDQFDPWLNRRFASGADSDNKRRHCSGYPHRKFRR